MSVRSCLWVTAILIYSRPFFQEDGNNLKDDDFKYTSFNTLRPRQNGRHFADAIFKCIFWNENAWILI